jgi:hypothetical protein
MHKEGRAKTEREREKHRGGREKENKPYFLLTITAVEQILLNRSIFCKYAFLKDLTNFSCEHKNFSKKWIHTFCKIFLLN